jgi:hypothetical protein
MVFWFGTVSIYWSLNFPCPWRLNSWIVTPCLRCIKGYRLFRRVLGTFICRTWPWKWSGYESSKCRQLQTQRHNVTCQKTWPFSSNTVRTSHLKMLLSVEAPRLEDIWGEWRYSCALSLFDPKWNEVSGFTDRLLYFWLKDSIYLFSG